MIPSLNVTTSATSASSGIGEPVALERLGERLAQDRPPLGVHVRDPLAQLGAAPRERLELEPDPLVLAVARPGSASRSATSR